MRKGGVSEVAGVLLDFFLIFLFAKLAAEVFERLRQPVVIGELLVGMLIGPHALELIGVPTGPMIDLFGSRHAAEEGLEFVYEVIAELGLIVLLFYVGLETQLEDLLRVFRRASVVAVLGVLVPMFLGVGFIALLDHSSREALFVGAALVATSVGITARVMRDLGVLGSREARIILGAAVVDDILALLVLVVVSDLATEDTIDFTQLALVSIQAVAFIGFALMVGTRLMARYSLHLERLRVGSAGLLVAIALMLGMSALAAEIGLAGIIGAFLAGIVLAESRERLRLERDVRAIYEFLVPFFFVLTGAKVDPGVFTEPATLGLAVAITGLAIAGKVIGCGAGGWGLGWRSMAILGTGMAPRGEIGFVVASIGLSLGAISDDIFSAVVFMSIATTLLAPPALQALYRVATPKPSAGARVEAPSARA
ncbi:MAG: cation:proton antiporter [Dehalococcoidia bacterium]|nr:cation:proton antiporter [Dehalococcoidia bacterium]